MAGNGKRTSRKPTIRIVRNLARSGGTLIGKCIGCMDDVVMLSEVHPADLKTTNPMMQAHNWFGLIHVKDITRFKKNPPSVLQFVALCEMRCSASKKALVLRDWSHLDYMGVPFAVPAYGFALRDVLESAYDIKSVTTTRHPIDQYLSLMELEFVASKLGFEQYLLGCAKFAEYASEHGFYRYEDFTNDPDSVLQSMSADLDLVFDASYKDKWFSYTTITGDTVPELGRGSTRTKIESFARKEIDPKLVEAFRANADYQRACSLLGYES